MRTTGIVRENDGTIYVEAGTSRTMMVTAAAARALEDMIKSLPSDSVPLRRVSFGIVVECRQAEGESPARVVVVEADLTVQKIRQTVVVENNG